MRKAAVARAGASVADAGENPADAISHRAGSPPDMIAYMERVKRFTNQEVSEQLATEMQAIAPGLEMDENTWCRIRMLVDELHWRLSGLE
ncbi:MAG TPA: hypothetical protein VGS20_02435 [Candidatus Acidoferrales bacterium]|nr:hypothetical protein [Candidatus Acidoferrales bacterium]